MYIIIYIYIYPRVLHSFSRCIDDYIFLVIPELYLLPSSFLDPRSYTKILLSFFEELLAPVVNGQVGEAEVAADIVAFPGEVESFFAWKGASWASKFGMAFIWLYKWQFFLCLDGFSANSQVYNAPGFCPVMSPGRSKKAPVIQDIISAFCASTEDLNLILV